MLTNITQLADINHRVIRQTRFNGVMTVHREKTVHSVDHEPLNKAQARGTYNGETPKIREPGTGHNDRFSSRYLRLQRRRNNFYIAGAVAILVAIITITWIAYDNLTVDLDRSPNTIPVLVERGPSVEKNGTNSVQPFVSAHLDDVAGSKDGEAEFYDEHSRPRPDANVEIPPLVLLTERELSKHGARTLVSKKSRATNSARTQRKVIARSSKQTKYRQSVHKNKRSSEGGHGKGSFLKAKNKKVPLKIDR